jgi:hypothetical protein
MVTVFNKVNLHNGITWINFSGGTADVIQAIANEGLTARHVVKIQYSSDGTTALALACRRE